MWIRVQVVPVMKRVRRILLPTDFSDSAATAGELAADLALRYDAGVDVVHVFKGAQDIEPFGFEAHEHSLDEPFFITVIDGTQRVDCFEEDPEGTDCD